MAWTRISSIWQIVPSRSWRILDKVCWKISGAELMPNGSLLKQYRPNCVTKVVSCRDSSSRGICQNPLLASSLENILLRKTLIDRRHRVNFPLDGFVRLGQVNTDSYFAIWVEDWDNSCTPFSWSCYRRDDTLFKHCLYLTFHLW